MTPPAASLHLRCHSILEFKDTRGYCQLIQVPRSNMYTVRKHTYPWVLLRRERGAATDSALHAYCSGGCSFSYEWTLPYALSHRPRVLFQNTRRALSVWAGLGDLGSVCALLGDTQICTHRVRYCWKSQPSQKSSEEMLKRGKPKTVVMLPNRNSGAIYGHRYCL